ncbi:MAG TPA: hypothetical protein VGZ00_08360 [Candidatus Baltobacteraceae bacterium]|jgi:hypothetical protein|nr:hypothetical protein [Candidatus Baltobacteraceae bacterium]
MNPSAAHFRAISSLSSRNMRVAFFQQFAGRVVWWVLSVSLLVALAVVVVRMGLQTDLEQWIGGRISFAHGVPLTLGDRSYAAVTAPGTADGWLSALLANRLENSLGEIGMVAERILIAFLAFAILSYRCRRSGINRWGLLGAAGFALTFSTGALLQGSGGWPLLVAALTGLLCELHDRRARISLVLLSLLVAQTGPVALIIPAWQIAVVTGKALEQRYLRTLWEWDTAVAAACIAALFATPSGITGLVHAVYSLGFLAKFSLLLSDPNFWPSKFNLGTPEFLFILALAASYRRAPPTMRPGIILAGILSCVDLRLLASMAILIAPGIAGVAKSVLSEVRYRSVGILAAVVALGMVLVSRPVMSDAPLSDILAGLRSASGTSGGMRMFCLPPTWCDLALSRTPNLRVLIDGRMWLYPASVRRDAVWISQLEPNWESLIRVRNIDGVVVAREGPFASLASLLELDKRWHERRFGDVVLFVRVPQ